MFLPSLGGVSVTKQITSEFSGYNHRLRINRGEWFDMENMSANFFPVLSPRSGRGTVRTFTKLNGLYAHDKLCWVDGTDFYYGGVKKGIVSDEKKQFVSMGSYVLIWPDKVYYNASTDEFGPLGNSVQTSSEVSVTLCKIDGTAYENYTVSESSPSNPSDGQLWIDSSAAPHVLKQYSNATGTWVSVPTTYAKIASTGIGSGFSEYDGVSISGMEEESLNGEFILYGVSNDYVIITAVVDEVLTQAGTVTLERKIPDMDYVTESENRVWGCSSENHEIYACKLGDPKNWNSFLGIASDSYAMTVGSPGDFTGCITHLGYVLFFKEDVIHKIYGSKPSNYQLTNTNCRGVEKGSEKSLVIVNETLYYKARNDVCAYNSALPVTISEVFGDVKYKNATAGAYDGKYYISMQDQQDNSVLFVYDELTGLWHKEDNTYAEYFADLDGELYFAAGNKLYSVSGNIAKYADTSAALEGAVEWMVESGDIGIDSPDNKYISKLQFRLEVSDTSLVRVELQYDHDGVWVESARINMTERKSFTLPVIPRRCDTLKIRLSGWGDFKLYSIAYTIGQGSDV